MAACCWPHDGAGVSSSCRGWSSAAAVRMSRWSSVSLPTSLATEAARCCSYWLDTAHTSLAPTIATTTIDRIMPAISPTGNPMSSVTKSKVRPWRNSLVCMNKSSAVAEMGDRRHNTHGSKREGMLCRFAGEGGWVQSNTISTGPYQSQSQSQSQRRRLTCAQKLTYS